ncbi:MAG: hypothetical protein IIZ48_08295 [Erysipelotrichales bacterium]|nr:hypothetical protein [Erysipelotrichales bacterium]
MKNWFNSLSPIVKRKFIELMIGLAAIILLEIFCKDQGWKYFLTMCVIFLLCLRNNTGPYWLFWILLSLIILGCAYKYRNDPPNPWWINLPTLIYWTFHKTEEQKEKEKELSRQD